MNTVARGHGWSLEGYPWQAGALRQLVAPATSLLSTKQDDNRGSSD